MVRFLHTSDWQLGMTRHFLIGSEAQERFSQDRIDAIGTLADAARQHDCAFVVVAGDVFDTNQPQRRTLERALEALAAFAVPVYLLPGNHDHQGAESVYHHEAFATRCPANVEILDGEPRTPVDGVEVVGAPWTSNHPLEDLVTRRCRALEPSGALRVVVGHGQVDDVVGDHGEPATIRLTELEAAMREANVAYVALGDRHSVLAVGETGRVWYSGAPEATDYRDGGPGQALIVDLPEADLAPDNLLSELPADLPTALPTVLPVEIGRWRFHRVTRDVDSDADVAALLDDLDGITDRSRAVVKVAVQGTLSIGQAVMLDEGLALRSELFGALEHPDRHRDLAIRPSEKDVAALPLSGYAAVARDRLVTQAQSDDAELASRAADALALLTRFVGQGRS